LVRKINTLKTGLLLLSGDAIDERGTTGPAKVFSPASVLFFKAGDPRHLRQQKLRQPENTPCDHRATQQPVIGR
jgi:hypothetical protein